MTQLEIYKRQLEIANQLFENAKNNNMSSEDISMYEDLCDLCNRSIEVYESNQGVQCELDTLEVKEKDLEKERQTPNKPKNILRRIFCRHAYKFYRTGTVNRTEADFSGDGCYNSWQEHYTEYVCSKCGERKKIFK